MKLIHYSCSDSIALRSRRQDKERSGCYKPNGLWVSDEATDWGWSHWCEAESFSIGDSAFEITLAPDANLLVIKSDIELIEFDDEFKFAPYSDIPNLTHIDWKRIAKRWHGIIITPYLFSQRFDIHWYYGWDCASGCIWNKKAIEKLEGVRQ